MNDTNERRRAEGQAMSLRSTSFFVPGKPQQKGSTKSLMHPRTKKIVTMSANKNLKLWEATVRLKAREAKDWSGVSDKAIGVDVAFLFPRPRCDYGTGKNSETLKDGAPQKYIKNPDLDKLVRGVLDGLSGVLFTDDRQVTKILATKHYGEKRIGALIAVEEF